EPYRSPEFFEREKEKVFMRAWLMIAREEEIPNPGDYVVKPVEIADASILLTRTKSGAVRAFYNSCAHRGSEVVTEPKGRASRIVCPYHQWTYTNEGDLIGVPDEVEFFMDKKKCGLAPVTMDIWEGYVFINFQQEPEVSLLEFLGPLTKQLEGVPYASADNSFLVRAEINANWKVVSDAFLESYHIPAIHPETIGTTFSSGDNPHARLLDAKILGSHAFVSMYGNPQFELEERHKIDRVAQKLDSSGSVISAGTLDEMADFLAHPTVNPTKTDGWSMDSVYIFPNTHINWGPGGFWIHNYWPIAHNRCRHETRFFMARPTSARQRLQQELYVARVIEVIAEDVSNTERTQRGLTNPGQTHMQLQDNEIAIRHSVNRILHWVSSETMKEAVAND
ncbi:MAG: aromatic ring-hydroxylating dioxygenase subunit alpha, partial [Novosphingobium sp.]|nr:aromatic ring-hydroxylating dioxygenase subunit alpha [Novosphingobium sp.]